MNKIAEDKTESLLGSFVIGDIYEKDMRRARVLEKRTVHLYRYLPHITYVETLDSRIYRKVYKNSFSRRRNRMDECGRASLTSVKRKG